MSGIRLSLKDVGHGVSTEGTAHTATQAPDERRWSTTGLACGEVRGGNEPVYTSVDLPGLRGILYSRPCHGPEGGDVHYLSVCGSGLVTRLCVADVAGHGQVVAAVGREMHAHLRKSVNKFDDRRVMAEPESAARDRGSARDHHRGARELLPSQPAAHGRAMPGIRPGGCIARARIAGSDSRRRRPRPTAWRWISRSAPGSAPTSRASV